MINLYITSNNGSCEKARSWLLEKQIPFVVRNIKNVPLTGQEIKELLSMTENGTEDIISTRTKTYKQLNLSIDDLTFNKLVQLLETYPELLKLPILFDKNRLQVGYHEDSIKRFIPREIRKAAVNMLMVELFSEEV